MSRLFNEQDFEKVGRYKMEVLDFGYVKVINDKDNESGWAAYSLDDKAGIKSGDVLVLDNNLGSLRAGDRVKINDKRIITQVQFHHYEFGKLVTSDWQDFNAIKAQ